MKGFLSFLGITLITVAFGAILLSFYGNPLEDLKIQERQLAYQEMRAKHSASADLHVFSTMSEKDNNGNFIIEDGQSCSWLSFDQ